VLAVLAPPAQAETILGLTSGDQLVTFASRAPGTILSTVNVTGLQSGELLLGIDVRPATGQLYGLCSTNRIYTINPWTGAAAVVGSGPFTPALTGSHFGLDFNPVPDAIRIVSDEEQNLRVNPNTGAVLGTDVNLAYAPGDPNFGGNPMIVAVAYSNNTEGAANTTLYGIDSLYHTLVRQGAVDGGAGGVAGPNGGQLFTIGPLGVVVSSGLAGPIGSFFAFAPAFTGGVFVGCLDLNYDGKADVVVGAGAGGGPHVRVFDGATGLDITGTPLGSFFPFPPAFTGGVFVGGN
jgi:hypothetical protein